MDESAWWKVLQRMYLCLQAINIKDVPKWMDLVKGPPIDVFMFTNN